MLKKAIKLVTNNFGFKVLALFFAVVLWLVVLNIDDPTKSRTFTTSVSLENEEAITNMGKYYEIMDGRNTISFKVSAKRSILNMLSNSDFRAVADMSRIEDNSRVPVEITPTRYTSSIEIQSKDLYLDVSVEDSQTKQLVINAASAGTPGDDCAVDSVSIMGSNVLKISGPESVVSTIDRVVATINVEGVTTTITDSVIPTLLDQYGGTVDTTKLTLSMQTVNIKAEIKDIKYIDVKAVITGTPAEGYVNTAVAYSPERVAVKGAAAVLNTVNTVEIPEGIISIDGATETIEQSVNISTYLPDGISLMSDEDKQVTVTVVLEKIETRMFEVPAENITVNNVPTAYNAVFPEDAVKVYIRGLKNDLDRLSAEDIKGSVSVSGMGQGDNTVVVDLELDEELYSTNGEQTATIYLERKNSQNAGNGSNTNSGSNNNDNSGSENQNQNNSNKKPEGNGNHLDNTEE